MFRQFVDVDIAFNLNTLCSISFGFSKVRWLGFVRKVILHWIIIFFFYIDEIIGFTVTRLVNFNRKSIFFYDFLKWLYFVGVDTRFYLWFCDGSWEFILVCGVAFWSLSSFNNLLISNGFYTLFSGFLSLKFILLFHRN